MEQISLPPRAVADDVPAQKKKKPAQRNKGTGLNIPIVRVRNWIDTKLPKRCRMQEKARVAVTAALEYVVWDITKNVEVDVLDVKKQKTILFRNVRKTIKHDPELKRLFGGVLHVRRVPGKKRGKKKAKKEGEEERKEE